MNKDDNMENVKNKNR